MSNRWERSDAPRGDDYDARWRALEAEGHNIHGEADLVEGLLREHGGMTVLDAGCGTGRVAIELARRGFRAVGVDSDVRMLSIARAKAAELTWIQADLVDLGRATQQTFDLVLLAGNVMIFLEPGSEGRVLAELASRLAPGGLLVAGFSVTSEQLTLEQYDRLAAVADLELLARWATWDRMPVENQDSGARSGSEYAVSVHRFSSRH